MSDEQKRFRITIHHADAFDVAADCDGQLTIKINTKQVMLELRLDEGVFAELTELVDDAVGSAVEEGDDE